MKIALFQAQTGIDPAANAEELVRRVAEAAAGGAAMLFTPEMSGLLDRDKARAAAHLHGEADDPVLKAVRDAAAEAGIWVHIGSLALTGAPGGKLVNRGFVIDDKGEIRARYDKIHLFDVDLPTGESWRESASYRGGEHAVVGRHADRAAWPLDLLRPQVRRSLFRAQQPWRDRVQHPRGVHRADRGSALARAAAGAGDRSGRVRHRRRPGRPRTRTAGRPTATRSSSIPGAKCCSTWAARRPASASPISTWARSRRCARACRRSGTGGRSRRRNI